MRFAVQAPSNIALVKYMGKLSGSANLPENSSLSMTLDRLCTVIEVESASEGYPGASEWIRFENRALTGDYRDLPALWSKVFSEAERTRFVAHAERVCTALTAPEFAHRERFARPREGFVIRSANTFPAGAGIASSASSFAALTLAVAAMCARDRDAFMREYADSSVWRRCLARIARTGSGSSCRSFEGPFVRWSGEDAVAVPSEIEALLDFVIVVNADPKEVSSSEAHQRVRASPLWEGRPGRANARVTAAGQALARGDYATLNALAWEDAWEMHSLFHTASPPFTYWQAETMAWLRRLMHDRRWLVTLDAGPNLHVLVRESESAEFERWLKETSPRTEYLVDRAGTGARFR